MTEKTANIETVETTEQQAAAPEVTIDKLAVESLTKEIDDFKNAIKEKVYPIKVKNMTFLSEIINFVEEEAEWKAMEALGVFELSQQLKEAAKGEIKNECIFVKSLAIQALNFFVNKMTGTGLEEANRFLSYIRPVNDSMKLIKADTDHLNQLEMKRAAAENGIKLDSEAKEETENTETKTE
jgi:hypothetical protein